MCGEYYSGWFDTWGKPRESTSSPEQCTAGVRWMVENGVSFNLYMLHGGTNFGFFAGANANDLSGNYQPDITSYDYSAPINEQGATTPRYEQYRGLIQGHLGTPLPSVPAPMSVRAPGMFTHGLASSPVYR